MEACWPLAFVQSADNRTAVLSCGQCGAFVGGARAQLIAIAKPTCKWEYEAALPKVALPLLKAARVDASPNSQDVSSIEFCRNGCGDVFCSSACEFLAFASGHALTCVGQLTTTKHPLYELKVAALQSGHYDIVTLAVKIFAMAVADGGTGAASGFLRNSAALAAQTPWDEGLGQSDIESELASEEGDESFTAVTWSMISAAFDLSGRAELSDEAGANLWPRLLGYVACRATEVELPSPLVDYCRDALSASLAEGELQVLQATILRWTERLVLERSGSEDDHISPRKKPRRGGNDDAFNFSRLADDSTTPLPRLHGLAVVPRLDDYGRSCLPNCTVTIAKGHSGGVSFCISENTVDEPPTLCPFSSLLSSSECASMWRSRGEVTECTCARCVFEGGGPAASTVGMPALRRIARLAQEDLRFTDALHALSSILEVEPNDGDALFSRARVTGWDDRWSHAHRLLVAASSLAPEHVAIRSQLAEVQAFILKGPHPLAILSFDASAFERVPVEDDFAFVSVKPILPPAECARAIADVEAFVEANGGTWTTQRHFSVPTTDVQVHAVPSLLAWFSHVLQTRIFPALGFQYGVHTERMRVIDAFLVKYDAQSQRSLPLHHDQSQYSLTLPLNSSLEYVGGGTYFAGLDSVLNCCAGGMISFPGRLLHGAHPISSGIRYVIVAFLYEYHEDTHQKSAATPTRTTSRFPSVPVTAKMAESADVSPTLAVSASVVAPPVVPKRKVANTRKLK